MVSIESLILIVAVCFVSLYFWYRIRQSRQWWTTFQMKKELVVITGGSSGIGKSVAIACAKRGADVVILARDRSRLLEAVFDIERVCKNEQQLVRSYSVDVTDAHSVYRVFNEIESDVGPISILVNCAGFAICGVLESITDNDAKRMIDTNFFGTLNAIRSVAPLMKKRNRGRIILMSSIAGAFGIYGYSVYSASKFALRGLAESLDMELKPYNVTITLAMPPDTNTPGFVAENRTKPLVTQLISESGGLYEPHVVAERLLIDALDGRFFSTIGVQGFLISNLCSGFSPIYSYSRFLCEIFTMGFIRLIAVILLQSFYKIIKKNVKK